MPEPEEPGQSSGPEAQGTKSPEAPAKKEETTESTVPSALLGWVIMGGIYVAVSETARNFVLTHWKETGAIVVLLVLLLILPATRRWLAETATRRVMFLILVVIPVVGLLVFLPSGLQVFILRLLFVVAVSIFPAVMYYLFITTAKASLLNEFVSNLERLGVLEPPSGDSISENERFVRRIQTYLQKFESFYGTLPADLIARISDMREPRKVAATLRSPSLVPWQLGTIFTRETVIPLSLATLLSMMGWFMILPPGDLGIALVRAEQAGEPGPAKSHVPAQPAQEAPLPAATPPKEEAVAALDAPKSDGQNPASQRTSGQPSEAWWGALAPTPNPINFAFLGAYFFSLQMLFRRYVRRDLRANAYVAVSLRIVLAIIGTWVVVAAFPSWPKSVQLTIAFVIGVFPRIAWQFIQEASKRVTAIALPNFATQLPVTDLDGLTVWHQSRLEEEDVENIPNMATADIGELMLQTRFPTERIVDWVDQAILYTFIGPDDPQESRRNVLRGHGIRTATALIHAHRESVRNGDHADFEKILAPQSRSTILSLISTMATNPNLKLVQRWRGV